MIGAGVFTTSAFALADMGTPQRVLAAWLIGGGVAVCRALSYGALAQRITLSGGEYVFLLRAVHAKHTSLIFHLNKAIIYKTCHISSERQRFLNLFDQLMEHTFEYLERVDTPAYASVPVDSDVMFLGTRANKTNIGGLVRHLLLAERHWFESLSSADDGVTIPLPGNSSLLEGVGDGQPLVETCRSAYARCRPLLEKLTEIELNKRVSFVDRHYTVMALLWTVLGHHNFYRGQVDLVMRQENIQPPEYMEWPEVARVLG